VVAREILTYESFGVAVGELARQVVADGYESDLIHFCADHVAEARVAGIYEKPAR
jgi:hypothetical protein